MIGNGGACVETAWRTAARTTYANRSLVICCMPPSISVPVSVIYVQSGYGFENCG
jgi:hypothetical protein